MLTIEVTKDKIDPPIVIVAPPPPPKPVKKPDDSLLTARITDISMKGMVTIKFNRALLVFPNATEILSSDKIL